MNAFLCGFSKRTSSSRIRSNLLDSKFRRYLENTLKIHQIFALVDVDFTEVFSKERSSKEHSSFDAQNLDIVKSHYFKVAE